ncbi:SDR family oxidoreductase [Peptoniphilus sp. MSJ-1]|uniref:SDR family oxidoreductase n=1 Tax=Peptoniphilus ovalis TaxID=2841503 RepID=A0ABS6FI93_9FIRM|nr:SDR family NAD(P)-dependent oxidoreductase [Peptoniphilus ovalis]MBU5669701.1 SDR family oxidoreductase [Peptoniphilus ovalis]
MNNLFDLTGRVAVVTGASSGLGVQFARALASAGADLAIIARREEKLKSVKEEIEKEFNNRVEYYKLDLSEFEKIEDTVTKIEKDFGKIDILVNNAGLSIGAKAIEISIENWKKMMDLNLNAVFFMAREVAKVMKKNNYGRIINIGSVHSTVSLDIGMISPYVTSKFGVRGITTTLAGEWAEYGITVNAIGPAYFESEMTEEILETDTFKRLIKTNCPMRRPGRKGELDTTLLYLASDYTSYTNGQLIGVDGGWTTL